MAGIITGAVLSSLIFYGVNHYEANRNFAGQNSNGKKEVINQTSDNKSLVGNFSEENQKKNTEDVKEISSAKSSEQNENKNSRNEVAKKNFNKNESSVNEDLLSSHDSSEENKSGNEIASVKNNSAKKSNNIAISSGSISSQKSLSEKSSSEKNSNKANTKTSSASVKKSSQENGAGNLSQRNSGEASSQDFQFENIAALNKKLSDTLQLNNEEIPARIQEPSLSLLNQDSSKKKFQLNLPKIDVSRGWDATKNSVSKFTDSIGNKTSGFFAKLFKSDSSNEDKKAAIVKVDSPAHSNSSSPADTFKHRFAQVSFVSPLGSDGMNGKDYVHNLSFNVLQGYSGALNGFELGGLVNVEKGYVKGMQIGGLVNFAFGDVNGFQLGGLVNNGKNVEGFQLGGIVNTATGTMNGLQLGGIANFARDTMNGLQLGGIVNVATSENTSKVSWQIAGISNVSLGKTTGGQISGIANVANEHSGVQIGLINVSKKISGFQLGLINVADSIDGESLGLINVSRNGIHNVDVFGSEILLANAGFKLGSPHIYTQFAFGIRPYADLTRMGFGLGIGGHVPFNHGFVNIDGMCWTIHNDNLNNWDNVNLWNQIRIMGGYQITKGVAIYVGPTMNLHVYDLSYPAIAPYTIYTRTDGTTRLDGWIGGVIGFQFF